MSYILYDCAFFVSNCLKLRVDLGLTYFRACFSVCIDDFLSMMMNFLLLSRLSTIVYSMSVLQSCSCNRKRLLHGTQKKVIHETQKKSCHTILSFSSTQLFTNSSLYPIARGCNTFLHRHLSTEHIPFIASQIKTLS